MNAPAKAHNASSSLLLQEKGRVIFSNVAGRRFDRKIDARAWMGERTCARPAMTPLRPLGDLLAALAADPLARRIDVPACGRVHLRDVDARRLLAPPAERT